ncbi:MAG: SPOR domain-containing protein [Acidiferrobacterales bacterium]
MAEPEDTSHHFNPKHRIIGAVVLVALAVLLIPLILRNRESKSQPVPSVSAAAPSGTIAVPPSAPPLPMTPGGSVPPPAAAAAPMAPAAPAPAPAPAPSQPQAAAALPEAVPRPKAVPVRVRRRAPVHSAVHVARGWIVQLGAFSRRQNALRVRQALEHKGFRAELDDVRIGHRRGVRVRVGPVRSRREAGILEAHIARQTGIKGVVLIYP